MKFNRIVNRNQYCMTITFVDAGFSFTACASSMIRLHDYVARRIGLCTSNGITGPWCIAESN